MQEIGQTSTCPKLPRKTNCPNSAHVLQFPSQCKSAITMATSLPTTMPCKTQSRQRCSEHGHRKKMAPWASNHNRDWTQDKMFRCITTHLLKHKCHPTPLRIKIPWISWTIRSTCQKIFTNPNQNYEHWNTMLKRSKSCNSNQTTSNWTNHGG